MIDKCILFIFEFLLLGGGLLNYCSSYLYVLADFVGYKNKKNLFSTVSRCHYTRVYFSWLGSSIAKFSDRN